MEILYYPILDTNRPRAQALQQQIEGWLYNTLITDDESKANAYLVWWWDGFMLDTIKKQYDFSKSPEDNKLFFWVNCGTLWFLLNDITIQDIPKNVEELEVLKANLMKVEIVKNDSSTEIKYAINDVVVWGNMLDYFKFDINSTQIKKDSMVRE